MSSQTCNSCRGTRFTLTDGFMYCDTCGAMLENFEELEEEDEQRINVGRAKIRVKKKKVAGGRAQEGEDEEEDQEKERKVRSEEDKMREKSKFFTSQPGTSQVIPPKSTPDYLYRTGIRLATFSQLLSRCAKILVNDLNMPPEYNGACLRIFQKYLSHCQIAFCNEELTDDVDLQFSAIVENKDYEREEAERKKRKIEERKTKGLKILGQSTAAWQLLTQGNLDETLAQEEEEEEESTLVEETQNLTFADGEGFLKRINTRISKNAVKKASQILLNLEFLAAILYFAANSIGCRNLLISDIIRWLREDRFGISRKEINLLNRGGFEKYKSKQQQGEWQSFLDFHETDLRFPLYEIYRVVVLMEQSLELKMEAGGFEKLSARLIDNLNLPSDLHHRCLILHSLIPCNFDFWHQANSKNGYSLAELADMKPNTSYAAFMNCFGNRESLFYESSEEEVLLTPETKILAYILFALKLSIDLDGEVENENENEHELKFDIDTYLHQLEMRLKCWQGHDISKILRESAKIPEIAGKLPFGDNFHPQILTWDVGNLRWRRQYGFRQCVPMDLGFEKTHNLPTIFKTRQNSMQNDDFQLPEALLSPLKFQRRVVRKEHVEYEDNLKTFNKSFLDLKIVENSGRNEDFAAIFPAAKRYLKFDKPDRTSKCVARKNRGENSSIHRIYLSLQTIQDIYLCAEDSISPRFDFLLKSFALTIGEDFRAIYTAFCMLETHFLQPDKIHKFKSAFLNSDNLPMNFEKYRKTGKYRCWQVGITPEEPISSIDELDLFRFSDAFCFVEGTSGDVELSSESDDNEDEEENNDNNVNYPAVLRSLRFRGDENSQQRRELRLTNRAFDFDTIFAILSLKNW
ncbi:unnamed protein product [Caenorhabditis angaria]|uniref:Rrn7/TAF1B C-terminal cyclin domain-containing protein n=1 Tax=Caenorhabditis angaria TaxID=860376 RepID=A0A9P1IGN6_9PELO|nr:unnamed protein product [Caenorhabditis angaria]